MQQTGTELAKAKEDAASIMRAKQAAGKYSSVDVAWFLKCTRELTFVCKADAKKTTGGK